MHFIMSSEVTLQPASGDQTADSSAHQSPGIDEVIDGVRLAFQGGGAKGIVHIGALMAVEELKLPIEAVAGTSAGAMVAALIAAGYTARELLDPDAKTHILQQFRAEGYGKAPALFGTAGWATISLFRRIKKWWMPIIGLLACMVVGALVLDVFHPRLIIGIGLVATLLTVATGLWFLHGITTVKPIRDLVDLAIRKKLADQSEKPRDEIPRNLTFEDLSRLGGLPLKIVATNISDEVGEVFSLERTPDVPVADAVAASICLPIVFRPWRFLCARGTGVSADIKERSFLDGGLISNLPVWTLELDDANTLDETQSTERNIYTFAFAIRSGKPELAAAAEPAVPKRKERFWLRALGSSVISGSIELDTRGVKNMIHIPIECTIGMLQFDAGLKDLAAAVSKAKVAVRNRIIEDCKTFPHIVDAASSDVQLAVKTALQNYKNMSLPPVGQSEVAIALVTQKRGNYNSFELTCNCPSTFREWPEIAYEALSVSWEENQWTYRYDQDDDGNWAGAHWQLIIPVSRRTNPARFPSIEGRPERPLLFILEFEATPRNAEAKHWFAQNEIRHIVESVVEYSVGEQLYSAVQRLTSTPWH